MTDDDFMASALKTARDTRVCRVGPGVRHDAAAVFEQQFGSQPALIVCDANTLAAIRPESLVAFRNRGIACDDPFVFRDSALYAADEYVQQLHSALAKRDGIPVAVGAGTINDITKLVAYRLGRQYMAVATAASMDGYTAFGSSITKDGRKQTFDCPAPLAVVADTDVIAAAPPHLNAAGYADLAAKLAAGADWIVADALGVEAIDPPAWEMTQSRLRSWLSNADGVPRGEPECIRRLTVGLMMTGFAMQRTQTSRPASGADHQFSHLWDMQHHTHNGETPSHGFKVGIGTLASVALYEELLKQPLEQLDVEASVQAWPESDEALKEAEDAFDTPELKELARREIAVKYSTRDELRGQLTKLKTIWPDLRMRLRKHLPPLPELKAMLHAAGCPVEPEQIGISRERLKASHRQAYFIRRRFTVLDVAMRLGYLSEPET